MQIEITINDQTYQWLEGVGLGTPEEYIGRLIYNNVRSLVDAKRPEPMKAALEAVDVFCMPVVTSAADRARKATK